MEMYVCGKCQEPIEHINDIVTCSNCGKAYHRWCSLSISNCIDCGCSNINFVSGVTSNTTSSVATQSTECNNSEQAYTHYINTETGIFSNIGEKMKTLATVVTVIGIIAGIIVFIGNIAIDGDLFFTGLLSGVAIAIISWIGSFALYGFGTLVSSSQRTERILREILKEIKK